jgi:hypothetical protein
MGMSKKRISNRIRKENSIGLFEQIIAASWNMNICHLAKASAANEE